MSHNNHYPLLDMTFFRPHGDWAGYVLICLCTYLLMTQKAEGGVLPMLCDKRFGERCIPDSKESTCNNVLTREWAYCKEYEHFCCKDWPTDKNFTFRPDRATIMLFQDDFRDKSVFG